MINITVYRGTGKFGDRTLHFNIISTEDKSKQEHCDALNNLTRNLYDDVTPQSIEFTEVVEIEYKKELDPLIFTNDMMYYRSSSIGSTEKEKRSWISFLRK